MLASKIVGRCRRRKSRWFLVDPDWNGNEPGTGTVGGPGKGARFMFAAYGGTTNCAAANRKLDA